MISRKSLLPAVALVLGVAVGVVLSGGGKPTTRRVDANSTPEVTVDVPHPESDWKRVRQPLTVYRVTHPDGDITDFATAPPEVREWRVTVAGTTYHGVPSPGE